jgi:hypothetical protein
MTQVQKSLWRSDRAALVWCAGFLLATRLLMKQNDVISGAWSATDIPAAVIIVMMLVSATRRPFRVGWATAVYGLLAAIVLGMACGRIIAVSTRL